MILKVRSLGDKSTESFLEKAEAKQGVTLHAMLFRPVQRICLYPLLFQQARG